MVTTESIHYPMPKAWADYKAIYAILDAARDEKIYQILMNSSQEFSCLYNGKIPIELARAAPYIIKIPTDSPLLDSIYQQAMYNSWGIFITCFATSGELRRHFQQFLKVKTEDGRRLYFRFYDPRVLRVYLPTCTKEELRTFFGPVHSIWIEDETPGKMSEFVKDGDRFFRRAVEFKM